ncbi:hypothetical protein V3M41_00900 [Trueperella pyogenes]|uniref:hypothetical protein n=1 Tax=Trueperella pyogenes TaxID=1661 RepID=UPI00345C89AF
MGTKSTDPRELSKVIARVIDDKLRERGISRTRAAELSGISQPRANRVLSGARPMYVDELGDFSRVLKQPVASIVREAEDAVTKQAKAASYAATAEAKLNQLLQSNYVAAAKHHTPDPYANLGEENQEAAT